jgi:hypothetical protein
MKKTGAAVAGAILTFVAWNVLASAIICWMSDKMDLFVFPWWQWWQCAPRLGNSIWGSVEIVASAAVATMLFGAIGVRLWPMLRGYVRQPKIWGTTNFADRRDMDRGGIKTKRKLF